MSDKIGIMLEGELIQFDLVKQIYFSPASYEVAKFLGPVNVIPRPLFALLGIEDSVPRGVESVYARAEAVLIEKDDAGIGEVIEVCFVGILILYRVRVRDIILNVYSLMNPVENGDRVSLKLFKYFHD